MMKINKIRFSLKMEAVFYSYWLKAKETLNMRSTWQQAILLLHLSQNQHFADMLFFLMRAV